MNKGIGMALLVVGIAMIVFGINASTSTGSDISRAVSGTPTDKSMWLLLGGIAAAIVGSVLAFRSFRKVG